MLGDAFTIGPAVLDGLGDKVPVNGPAPARPDLAQVDANAPPPRAVTSTKKDADYSTAYNDKTVSNVQQHGAVWQERVKVTSGYSGRITGVKQGSNGSTIVSVKDDVSGKLQRYVIESGAEMPANIKKNARIENGDVLANEAPRDYRWVEVQYSDGKPPTTRAEIKSSKPGTGWIQRGKESGERGAAAEGAAMKEADEALEAAAEAGEISSYARLSNKFGGGGFDDVLVEFTGEGKNMQASIRIREIKDYPNRHVPLGEFTAIHDNWAQNLQRLRENVDEAIIGKKCRPGSGISRSVT
ncbi:MAG: hypothetical protein WKG01_13770 [Kofleriaceae bacterium]